MTKVASYTGVRRMGHGPSAESLAGWSTMLGTSVVIKRYELGGDGDLERLLVDLDRWFSLPHDGLIVPIEAGTNDDGGVFVARPFVAGQPAESWIRATPRPDRGEILSVLAGVARTLAGLHRCGVSHGAVTASNIIVVRADERAFGLLTDPRPSVSFDADPSRPSANPRADTDGLVAVALQLLVGYPLPAGVERVLTATGSKVPGSRPSVTDLERALLSAAALPAPQPDLQQPISEAANRPRDPASLPPAGTLADDLEALRTSAPKMDHRGGRMSVWMALAATIVTLSGAIWWTVRSGTDVRSARPIDVTDQVQLVVSRADFEETPNADVEITITATIASAEPEERSCPGRDCSIELFVGRQGAADPGANGSESRVLAIDARRLGVMTSPRRGSLDALAPVDRPGGSEASNSPAGTTRLVFTVGRGTEILGLAALGDDSTVLGFSRATDWPRGEG